MVRGGEELPMHLPSLPLKRQSCPGCPLLHHEKYSWISSSIALSRLVVPGIETDIDAEYHCHLICQLVIRPVSPAPRRGSTVKSVQSSLIPALTRHLFLTRFVMGTTFKIKPPLRIGVGWIAVFFLCRRTFQLALPVAMALVNIDMQGIQRL